MFTSIPPDAHERWSLMRRFTTRFRSKPKRRVELGTSVLSEIQRSLGHELPNAVRAWYVLIDDIGDFWSGQDNMWAPDSPIIEGSFVPLMVENQNCFRMGYNIADVSNPDPPVHRYADGESEFQLSSTVSEFAIQMLILETIWSGDHRYFDCADGIDGQQAKSIEDDFRASELNDLHLWSAPIRFLAEDDVVFRLDYDGGTPNYAFMGFAAATDEAYNQTVDRLAKLGIQLVD